MHSVFAFDGAVRKLFCCCGLFGIANIDLGWGFRSLDLGKGSHWRRSYNDIELHSDLLRNYKIWSAESG